MNHQMTLVEQAKSIYESAREEYEYQRRNPNTSDTMISCAEQRMCAAHRHLQAMRHWAEKGMLD